MCTVSCILGIILYYFVRSPNSSQFTLIELSSDTNAKCLDGSNYKFYYKKGRLQNKVMIYLGEDQSYLNNIKDFSHLHHYLYSISLTPDGSSKHLEK